MLMYVQEDYSLSCDALTKDVKVTKGPLEVDLSRTMAQRDLSRKEAQNSSQQDVLTLTIHRESDSLHPKAQIQMVQKPKLRASIGT